jgi:hypothetical protein
MEKLHTRSPNPPPPRQQTETRRKSQIWEQHITSTKQIGDEVHKQKSEICSIKPEHDSHTTTEVTALPPSFDYWNIKFQILAH